MIREKLDDGEISDQETARAINKWKENNDMPVYKDLRLAYAVSEITGFPEKIEQFGELLDAKQVRVLAGQLFEVVFSTKELTDRDFPGRNELCRLASEKPFSGHGDWLIGEVSKLFSVSLSVATNIYMDWFGYETEAQRVRDTVLERAQSLYSDKDIFINAIKSDEDTAVRAFIAALSTRNYGGTEFKPDEWRWLADL